MGLGGTVGKRGKMESRTSKECAGWKVVGWVQTVETADWTVRQGWRGEVDEKCPGHKHSLKRGKMG